MRDGKFELGHEIKVLPWILETEKILIRYPSNLKRS